MLSDSGLFQSLEMKVAAALSPLINGDLARQVTLKQEALAKEGRFLKGRQMAWMMFDHIQVDEVSSTLFELTDLIKGVFKM